MRAAALPRSGRSSISSRRSAAFALSIVACLISGAPARAAETLVTLTLDQAEIMRLPAGTETIVVGNPIIADVTMLKSSAQLILTGKGYGDTNLVFLNGAGDVIAEARLRVREGSATLVVQRGVSRETYACAPRCQPTATLGDSSSFLSQVLTDIQARNKQATGDAAAGAASGGAAH